MERGNFGQSQSGRKIFRPYMKTMILIRSDFSPFAAAGARWTFGDKGGQMFERSEFLSARQMSAGRREPAQRARRWGAFSCLLLSGKEKK